MGPLSSADILLGLSALRETGRVLYIAAHPDDENTRLIAYFARGRGFATGYLSLTRGDGGQNLIGPELGPALGTIRTQELLAARALDGGQQFFARAIDFGFSKDYRETLAVWDPAEVLADMVRVFRAFRPDVVITRFSPTPGGTHGHHTASTILALDAFEQAGEATSPELGLPWKPARLFWNVFQFPSGPKLPVPEGSLALDLGQWLPLIGTSAGEIAARSRSMHRTQGFGAVPIRGTHVEYFKQLAGEPASSRMFEGLDTTWARYPGGPAIGAAIDRVIAAFDPFVPERSVDGLLQIRTALRDRGDNPVFKEKVRDTERLIAACAGLYAETTVPAADVVAGEVLALKHTAIARGTSPVRWRGVRFRGGVEPDETVLELAANVPAVRELARTLPADTPLTQPYWLEEPGTPGMFRVRDPRLIGRAEGDPPLTVTHVFEIGGETLALEDAPVYLWADPVKGEMRHAMRVIPPVSLDFVRPLELFGPSSALPVEVELTAARAPLTGEVRLTVPDGWLVSPRAAPYSVTAPGETVRVSFRVTAPAAPVVARLGASATAGGVTCDRRKVDLRHEHIAPQLLQPPAACKAVCLELCKHGRRVGYLPGAGDAVDAALERIGYEVVRLTDADLTPDGLNGLDAVVLGVRAYNTRRELAPRLTGLFQYIENGGTVVVQYNTAHALLVPRVAPFPLNLSRDRVTDQTAAVTVLAPDHPAITSPNALAPEDFAGWIHERGLYFPDSWDPRFTPLLAMADPGEAPKRGALVVARHGRGWFVYTGLSLFRQLPDGVPGAYRLLANLVSLNPASAGG